MLIRFAQRNWYCIYGHVYKSLIELLKFIVIKDEVVDIDKINYPQILEVPFEDKDKAKVLGAKWDASNKLWFVEASADIDLFYDWWPSNDYNPCYSNFYYVALSQRTCRICRKQTDITAIIIPQEGQFWSRHHITICRIPAYLTEVRWLDKNVIDEIVAINPMYYRNYSKTLEMSYWMNHCQHCKAKQGDFFLYKDTGGFLIFRPEDAKKIKLHKINKPLKALVTDSVVIEEFAWLNHDYNSKPNSS